MGYSAINSKADLILYIKRDLGDISHSLEISDLQIDDCISDAMQIFTEKCYDGSDESYLELDVSDNLTEYILDPEILAVLKVIKPTYTKLNKTFETEFYNNMTNFQTQGGYLDFMITSSYLNSIESSIKSVVNYTYNSTTRSFRILSSNINDIDKILLHVVKIPVETDINYSSIFGHRAFKALALALVWTKWGNNLSKYIGTIFDGTTQINLDFINERGKTLLDEAYDLIYQEFSGNIGIVYQ